MCCCRRVDRCEVREDRVTCPHCAAGNPPRWRSTTREWIHDYVDELFTEHDGIVTIYKRKGAFAHTICRNKKDPPYGR